MASFPHKPDTPSDSASETALIVHPVLKSGPGNRGQESSTIDLDEQLEEARGLARAIRLAICGLEVVNVAKPTAGFLIGKGKRQDIAALCREKNPDVVVVNHALSPVQQRNLEKEWKAKVIDRTGLILEIFGERAQTREGQIQVELAALEYQKSRLVRSWTHLERQRGGAGFMGGPGETQIEIDRRLITDRIAKLRKDLEHVRKTRDIQKRSRDQVPFPVVSLVGYTNAGKSTLFNKLTGSDVFAKDLLFATLDPTMRKLSLDNGMEIILSDTVGFISDLPTHLIAAFRATLEEVETADIILHVRDMASPNHEAHREDVLKILGDLDIDTEEHDRVIEVYNKIDALAEDEKSDLLRKAKFDPALVAVSALEGQGLNDLRTAIENILAKDRQVCRFAIPPTDGEALAWLYENAHILDRQDKKDYITVEVDIDPADRGRFADRFSYEPHKVSETGTDKETNSDQKAFHGT